MSRTLITRWLMPPGVTASVGVSGRIGVVPSAMMLPRQRFCRCHRVYDRNRRFATAPRQERRSALDRVYSVAYLTDQLFNYSVQYADRPAQRRLRRACRSDASRDPGKARHGRGFGYRTGRAVRNEPAGGLKASENAGARRAHLAPPGGAMAAMPSRAGSAAGSDGVARRLSPVLGRKPRQSG